MPSHPSKAKRIMRSSEGQSILGTENSLTQATPLLGLGTSFDGATSLAQPQALSPLILFTF
jgi:hypothetical protein